jgi:hypothetical protein
VPGASRSRSASSGCLLPLDLGGVEDRDGRRDLPAGASVRVADTTMSRATGATPASSFSGRRAAVGVAGWKPLSDAERGSRPARRRRGTRRRRR